MEVANLIFGQLLPGVLFGASALFALLAGRNGLLIFLVRRLRARRA